MLSTKTCRWTQAAIKLRTLYVTRQHFNENIRLSSMATQLAVRKYPLFLLREFQKYMHMLYGSPGGPCARHRGISNSGYTDPLSLNLHISLQSVVSFRLHSLYSHGRSSQYALNRGLAGPPDQVWTLWRTEKSSGPSKIPQLLSSPALHHYTYYITLAPFWFLWQ